MANAKCGWCLTSDHDNCVGTVLNGDGSPYPCGCTEHAIPDYYVPATRVPAELNEIETRILKVERPTGPQCTCECGGHTKGGKFLPGHDSKYISRAQDSIREGLTTLEDTLTRMEALGLSEALRNKLKKRME